MEKVDKIVDLGIVFCNNLSFDDHVRDFFLRSGKRAAIINNCFVSREPDLLFRAFVSFVRPVIEYCCSLWSPYSLKNIRKLECVQRRFTKRLAGLGDMPYCERLRSLGAETLELRRLKYDLTMYFKIFHGYVDLQPADLFKMKTSITRSNGLAVYINKTSSNAERYYFNNRASRAWNHLSSSVVHASSVQHFKSLLNAVDLTGFLYCK